MCIRWCRPRNKPSPRRYGRLVPNDTSFDIDRSKVLIMGQPPSHPTSPGATMTIRSPMATPALPAPYNQQLSTQHERLIVELLPLKDASAFQEWLQSVFVRGSWLEFCRDFLSKQPMAPEPDKETTAKAARDAFNSKSQRFLVFHPDKTDWTVEDHHVRFIVTVSQDNLMKSLWSEADLKKKSCEIHKAVFEVLVYLKATFAATDLNPPSYTQ